MMQLNPDDYSLEELLAAEQQSQKGNVSPLASPGNPPEIPVQTPELNPDDYSLEELMAAEQQANVSQQPAPWQDFLKGFVATGPASLVDMLAEASKSHPVSVMSSMIDEKHKNSQIPEESFTNTAIKKYHEITGFPEGEPGIAQTAGEFLSPVPGLSKFKAGKEGFKAAGKALAGALGASTAVHQLPNITQEGSVPENIAKAVIGSSAGHGVFNVGKAIANPKATLAKAASLGADPNIEALKLAEKHGIELPLNVGMRSTPLNWTSNVLSKTVLASKKFKDSLQRSNKSMLDAVKNKIDSLGKENIEPSVASQNFKNFLSQEEKQVKELVDKEYAHARKYLGKNDAVVPKNTIDSIHAMKEILTRDIQSPATKKVAGYVIKLADSWGIMPKKIKLTKDWEALANNPKAMSEIIDSFAHTAKTIPIEKLEGVRSELGSILGHHGEVHGMEKWLKGIRNSITKDFESSPNKKYVQEVKKANNFYRESYANRFKEDIAESILSGSEPLYTYQNLNDAHSLSTLERIAGESPKGKEILDSLKKAKTREIFNNALTDEGIKLGNFTRIFEKNEVNQEFLQKLLGKESYKDLHEISKIMREQIESGKDLLNTSSTAYVTSDLNKLSKFGLETTAALTALFSGNPTIALGALGAGAAKLAIPNLTSRLIADPKFIKQARAFAIARKNGNLKYSEQLLESMGRHAQEILRATGYKNAEKHKGEKNE